MKTLLIAASALALATPALAQTSGTTSAPATTAGSTANTTTSGAPDSTMSSTTAQGSAAMPMTSAPATASAPSDPKQIIATEFPTYDKDGNGALSTGEFDAWMVALKEKSGSPAMKPAEQTTWLKGAFTSADKDKSKSVSLTELTTYLTAAG